MSLLMDVNAFLRRSGMPPTRFGREALGDPRFVGDLRLGRCPGPRVRSRVYAFIARKEGRPGQCG